MENHEICDKVKAIFDPAAMKLKLGRGTRTTRHAGYSISYPGEPYGLEIEIDLMDFFIMPLVYHCNQTRQQALPTYRDPDTQKRHKDFLERIAERIELNMKNDFEKIRQMKGDHLQCEQISLELARLIESCWHVIASKPINIILSD